MKKINKFLTTALACGVLGGSVAAATLAPRASSEVRADDDYQTYVPVNSGWVEKTDNGIDYYALDDYSAYLRGRNDRFWSGASEGWDSQERTYNAVDQFIDSFKEGGNETRINYRTPELTLYDDDHRYICFNYSGLNSGEIFINVWNVSRGFDAVTNIKPFFDEAPNGTYDDNKDKADDLKKYGEITCNQTFRFLELPSGDKGINVGEKFLLFVHDGSTAGFGFFTFGGLYINQTLTEVAKHYSVQKTQMQLNKQLNTTPWNNNAIDYVMNFYATDDYYLAVRTAESNVDSVDDGFEVNTQLSNWAYDQSNSIYENGDLASLNFGYMYSDKEYKWGGYFYDNDGLMPLNKTGEKFLTGEPDDIDTYNTGLPESAKYRLVSPEFKLSGTGLISAKIGGHYARLSLLDANYDVLATTADGDGNNPAFKDADMTNIFTSGARMCTMTRFYLDCSKYLNQRVHIAIEDSKVGGGWGLAFFDEIITKYNSLPSFVLDSLRQTHPNSEHVDYGVIMNKLVLASSEEDEFIPAFKEAFDFVEEYFEVARNSSSNYSWCSVSKSDLGTLEDDYDGLSDEAKTLVDSSEDYYYVNSQVSKVYNIGQSMSAIKTGVYPVPNGIGFLSPLTSDGLSYAIIIIVSCSVILTFLLFFVVKKHKKQR